MLASDRICSVKLIKRGLSVLKIYGIYLPCDDHSLESMELYIDTLDQLQSLIDDSDPGVPIMIIGDMNACLPWTSTICKTWYKKRPYSRRSLALYGFLQDNELAVENFQFDQDCDYTYYKGSSRSYIDHVFVPGHMVDNVTKCQIISHEEGDNPSDHLPLSTALDVAFTCRPIVDDVNISSVPDSVTSFPRAKWDNPTFLKQYADAVDSSLLFPRAKPTINKENALEQINKQYDHLCKTLHSSVESSLQAAPQTKCNRNVKNSKWWNQDCAKAKRRNNLFHYIWKESGKPVTGITYENYKFAKKQFRKVCRQAANSKIKFPFTRMDKLYETNNSKQLWNIIRKCKNTNVRNHAISNEKLTEYFHQKFSSPPVMTDKVCDATGHVEQKFSQLCDNAGHGSVFISESRVRRYIKQLKCGTAAGHDGLTAEHLRYAIKTKLPLYLSQLFTLCLQFGEVPSAFCSGILVPLLKKSNIDPTIPKNYRPITISVVLSKILEYYILDKCAGHEYNPLQFGFVPGRSTAMVTSLAHDVCEFTKMSGSNVFLCSLDAEAAYDGIPHPILFDSISNVIPVIFDSISNVIPDHCWKILYKWYTNISVRVKWQNSIGTEIKVVKGLRQGRLTSPLLYNMF